jgi:hypothetical protein
MKSIDYEELGEYAPEQYGFYSMDEDGLTYLYEHKPEINDNGGCWEGEGMGRLIVNVSYLPSDWKQSLRKIKRYSQLTKDTKWGTPCEALLNDGWTECIFLGVENGVYHVVPRGTFQVEYVDYAATRIQNK